MSVTEIKRYRAKCDCCGGLGDLRDTHKEAVAHAIERQHWALVIPGPVGAESLLCQPCQKERAEAEGVDAGLRAERAQQATRALAAKAAVLDALLSAEHSHDTAACIACFVKGTNLRQAVETERTKRGLT